MIKKKQKCYIYTRVSTAIQVDGYSLEAQKDKLRKYAEYQDYTIVGEYSDEGFSGKNIQGRLEFQRMLQDNSAFVRTKVLSKEIKESSLKTNEEEKNRNRAKRFALLLGQPSFVFSLSPFAFYVFSYIMEST